MTTVFRFGLMAILVNTAITAQAVQFGWQELPGGGIEYLVQVEPNLLDTFHEQGFVSDLPSGLRDVRSVRITVGTEKLPNQNDLRGPVSIAQTPTVAAAAPETQPFAENRAGANDNSNKSSGGDPGGIAVGAKSTPTDVKSTPTTDQTLPPMPFLHSNLGKGMAPNNSNPTNAGEKLADSQSKSVDGSTGESSTGAAKADVANHRTVDKPSLTNSDPQNSGSSEAAIAKPWWALMGALLALFASLGTNVYLVWIHQAVRAKYRALVQRLPVGGAAAS